MTRQGKRGCIVMGSVLVCSALIFFLLNPPLEQRNGQAVVYGVTFSQKQAESLGSDWREAYRAALEDLGVKKIRIPAYWDVMEPAKGSYNFTDLDFMLDMAAEHDARVILAVGRKLPRWPECHDPAWISGFSRSDIERELLVFLRELVNRYRTHASIERWQVENELFFPFGICPNFLGQSTLTKEIELVRSLDTRPIVVTDAGEWSVWYPASLYGDILGSSLYREAWNSYIGRIPFPISPGFYQWKEKLLLKAKGKEAFFTEVQAEPWGPKAIGEMSEKEMLALMPLDKIMTTKRFLDSVGFREAYFWGVEWWYLLKQKGDPSIWNAMREVFTQSSRSE